MKKGLLLSLLHFCAACTMAQNLQQLPVFGSGVAPIHRGDTFNVRINPVQSRPSNLLTNSIRTVGLAAAAYQTDKIIKSADSKTAATSAGTNWAAPVGIATTLSAKKIATLFTKSPKLMVKYALYDSNNKQVWQKLVSLTTKQLGKADGNMVSGIASADGTLKASVFSGTNETTEGVMISVLPERVAKTEAKQESPDKQDAKQTIGDPTSPNTNDRNKDNKLLGPQTPKNNNEKEKDVQTNITAPKNITQSISIDDIQKEINRLKKDNDSLRGLLKKGCRIDQNAKKDTGKANKDNPIKGQGGKGSASGLRDERVRAHGITRLNQKALDIRIKKGKKGKGKKDGRNDIVYLNKIKGVEKLEKQDSSHNVTRHEGKRPRRTRNQHRKSRAARRAAARAARAARRAAAQRKHRHN